jgi:hypothetical protein
MRWLGVTTKVFSVGNYRRDRLGSMPNSWFDPNNKAAKAKRVKIANDCLEDLIKWITVDGGQVAVYDANSESVERRQHIFDRLTEEQIHPIFIGNEHFNSIFVKLPPLIGVTILTLVICRIYLQQARSYTGKHKECENIFTGCTYTILCTLSCKERKKRVCLTVWFPCSILVGIQKKQSKILRYVDGE